MNPGRVATAERRAVAELTSFFARCKFDVMIRTQIQLPDDLYRRAKQVAQQREISLAEMTRRGLELFLARLGPSTVPPDGWQLPTVAGGGIRVPLESLHDIAAADEMADGSATGSGRPSKGMRLR